MTNKELLKEERENRRKEYKREHNRERRKKIKEITVSCPKHFYPTLKKWAKEHKRSVSMLLFESANSYHQKTFLIPDEKSVDEIRLNLHIIAKFLRELKADPKDPLRLEACEILLSEVKTLCMYILTDPPKESSDKTT